MMQAVKRAIRRFSRRLDEITDAWEPLERVLSKDLEVELQRHPGEWVTMTHDRLIAAGSQPAEVMAAARAAGIDDAILYKVPEAGVSYILATTNA